MTVFLGPSGSGKSTVLRCLAGLERPERGHVRLGDHVWFDAARGVNVAPDRRDIGVLFQDYALFPHLTVERNVAFAARGLARSAVAQRVEELIEVFRLRGLETRLPRQLSGGQQQRVAVVRAVASNPALVLADEPTANLDTAASEALLDMMLELNQELGVTFIFATHDGHVMERSRRVVRMVDGAIDSDETRS